MPGNCSGIEIPKWSSLISLIRDIKPSICPQWMCTDYNIHSFMCLVLCFSEDFPPSQFCFTVPLPLSISPSVRENWWDGHNVGSVSGTEHRHLLWQEEDPQRYGLIFHWGFSAVAVRKHIFLCVVFLSRRVCVWWSLVRVYHGWCWVSFLLFPFKKFDI